jgi:hypothetical protein
MNWKYVSGENRHWVRQPDGLIIRPKSAKRFVLEDEEGVTLGDAPSLAAAQEYADRNIAPTV